MTQPNTPAIKAPPAPAVAKPATPAMPTFKVRSSKGPAMKTRRALYWGDSGNGKTTRLMSWPGYVAINFDPIRTTMDCHPVEFPVIDCLGDDIGFLGFEKWILPMLESRQIVEYIRTMPVEVNGEVVPGYFKDYPIKTFGLDSWTGLQKEALKALAGKFRTKSGAEDTQTMWGEFLRRMNRIGLAFANLSDPKDGTSYNHVASVHETVRTDEEGNITRIHPSVPGEFGKTDIFQYYDNVFFLEKYVAALPPLPGQPPTRQANYRCWTLAPDNFRKGPKALGNEKPLPATVNGDYPELCKLWGIEP